MKRIEQPVTVVVFGASGDLSKRKLIPALYHLAYQNLLPHNFTLIGYGRTKFTDEQFRQSGVREPAGVHRHGRRRARLARFLPRVCSTRPAATTTKTVLRRLPHVFSKLDDERDIGGNQLFYLSTPPSVFKPITYWLHQVGLCSADATGTQRIVIEKPFGHDLASAA